MNYCPKCHNCQLSVSVPPEKMFDNYLYVSSTAASFRQHFQKAAEQYIKEFNLNSNTLVVDIGSNDGVALKPLKEHNIPVVGIEPAKNIAELANQNGIRTFNHYFDDSAVKEIQKLGKAKLVTASNMFAHSDKLDEIAKNVFKILDDDGSFIIEVQYLKDTLKDLTFDNIYHEHYNYWSVLSLNNFFNRLGFKIYKVQHIETHGGSIRVYVAKNPNMVDASVDEFIADEVTFGLTQYTTYQTFGRNVEQIKTNVVKNIKELKKHYNICAYGSPAKATTALNYFQITDEYINYTVDDNPLKNEKVIPGVNIEIKNKKYFDANRPTLVIVLAWNFFDCIVENNKEAINSGIKFISVKDLEKDTLVL